MAKKFAELRARMSPEAQARSAAVAQGMRVEIADHRPGCLIFTTPLNRRKAGYGAWPA